MTTKKLIDRDNIMSKVILSNNKRRLNYLLCLDEDGCSSSLNYNIMDKPSNLNITSYKYDPELQVALFNFMGTIDDIYETLDLKFTNEEKIKIKAIRDKRGNNE